MKISLAFIAFFIFCVNYVRPLNFTGIELNDSLSSGDSDSLIVESGFNIWSPDSSSHILVDYYHKAYAIYDSIGNIRKKVPYDYEKIYISNDGRIVTNKERFNNALRRWNVIKFYSAKGLLLMDSIFYPGVDAAFINNDDLIIIHANNPFGFRSHKEVKDTKLLIFNKDYKMIFNEVINYPTYQFEPPVYLRKKKKYIFRIKTYESKQEFTYLNIRLK